MEKPNVLKKILTSKIFTLLVLLAVIVVFFEFASTNFSYLKPSNIKNILNSMVLYTLFAIAEGLLIISGEIDLSTGYVGVVSGVLLSALLATSGLPWVAVVVLCLLVGAAFGLFNAFLINELAFQGFIATLATGAFIARGLAYILVDGKVIKIENPAILWAGTGKIFEVFPVSIILALVLITVYGIILAKTKFGRSIYLCGSNRNAARLAGLNPRRLSYILFANSGALGALAGMLFVARMKAGNLTGTASYSFPAITAVILGGISFGGGSGGMLGCFLGLLIINGFNNGLTVMGVTPYMQSVFSGVLLLLALTLDFFSNKRQKSIKRNVSKKLQTAPR